MDVSSVFVGRQPILDRNLGVFGYELLFRDSASATTAVFQHSNTATNRTLLNAFVELGVERICGGHWAMFNVSRDFVLEHAELPFKNMNVGIEILEGEVIDDDLIDAVKIWKDKGYLIALDDFIWRDDAIELLKLADMVKVDVAGQTREDLESVVSRLKSYDTQIVAEKVETHEEMEMCRDLGFDLFQGYFLSKPTTLSAASIPENRIAVMRLLQAVANPDVTTKDLEAAIKTDISLTYKVLRMVNSAYYGLPVQIETVGHAIVYMGTQIIRNWVNMLALAELTDRPPELARQALVRARMCEEAALTGSGADPGAAFTVGLFSLIDALLGMPMSRILKELPLTEEVKSALREGTGPLGQLLEQAKACERAEIALLEDGFLAPTTWNRLWVEATRWADHALNIAQDKKH